MQQKNVKLFAVTLFYVGLTGLNAQTVQDINGNGKAGDPDHLSPVQIDHLKPELIS